MWCDVMKCGCDALYTLYDAKHNVCNVIHTKGVITLKEWLWWHKYSGCNITNIVNMMVYTMDMMSSYIVDEISSIQLVCYHQYSGSGDRVSVDMKSNIVG